MGNEILSSKVMISAEIPYELALKIDAHILENKTRELEKRSTSPNKNYPPKEPLSRSAALRIALEQYLAAL